MNKNYYSKDVIFGALGVIAGLVGVGYAIGTHNKMSKITDRLELTIDQLADDMEIDISEDLVSAAVEKAVADAAKKAVDRATNEAIAELKRDIHVKVSAAVEKEYDSIKDTVLQKTTEEAAKIDTARVRREVEKAAKESALAKFNDSADDILDQFNNNLNNFSRIYNAMAGVATNGTNAGKEFTFRVG